MITGCLPSPLGLHLESSSGVDRVPFLSAQLDIKWVVARRGDGRHRDSLFADRRRGSGYSRGAVAARRFVRLRPGLRLARG